MTASRSRLSLLALLAALGLMLAPHHALAGSAKPAAAVRPLSKRTQKVADKALANATPQQKAKALESLSGAMSSRKVGRTDFKSQAAYLKSSVAAQKGAATRAAKKKPAAAPRKKGTATAARTKKGAGTATPAAGTATPESEPATTDAVEADSAAPAGNGLWARFQRYRAARAAFRNLVAEDPEVGQELTLRARMRGSFGNGAFLGASGMLATAAILSGGTLLALVGGGGVAIAGIRELRNRDSVRKELVNEFAADKQLEPEEIATFEAAGWL